MWEYRIDQAATSEAYAAQIFRDKKRRSFIDNLGHVHRKGVDLAAIRKVLFRARKGLCETCGRYRDEKHADLAHNGKTSKTRCECFGTKLKDGSLCTGIRWLCSLDPRKGGNPLSCHGKQHGRIVGLKALAAVREEKAGRKLRTCARHPHVRFDGRSCPGCEAEADFLKMTADIAGS